MSLVSESLPIPQSEHVMVHARLKGLSASTGVSDYAELSAFLLSAIRARDPLSIVVPTFTYSYTKSLEFSVRESPSEVGRFSEEVRLSVPASLRTLDPVFSAVDVDGFGWAGAPILDAFGADSLWVAWRDTDSIILNLDLPHIVATQFHLIEKLAGVPYRYDKQFAGVVVRSDGTQSQVEYNYYVRDLDAPSTWNRGLLEAEVAKAGKLHEFRWGGVRGTWFRAREVESVIRPIMERDPKYLLELPSSDS